MAPAVAISITEMRFTSPLVQARYAAGGTITSEGKGMNELSMTMNANTRRYTVIASAVRNFIIISAGSKSAKSGIRSSIY